MKSLEILERFHPYNDSLSLVLQKANGVGLALPSLDSAGLELTH